MATVKGGYTTGAGQDEAELRRRNVTSYDNANGQHVYKVEAEDTKKLQKVGKTIPVPHTNLILLQPKSDLLDVLDEWEFLIGPFVFTAFALFTRLWRIGLSPIVTWDEAQ